MSQLDEELRGAASSLAREPFPPDVLDDALDEPRRRARWAAIAATVAAGVIVSVGAGLGVGMLTSVPSGSAGASGTANPQSSGGPDGPATASTVDLGVRLTLTLERDRTEFGQRLWADATVENLGPGSVYWDASCAWPVFITVAPRTPTGLDMGREDWPANLDLFKSVLTPEPYSPDRHREFEAEAVVNAGSSGGCPPAVDPDDLPDSPDVPEGTSISHRAAWDSADYMAMPPPPGLYNVNATFSFWRGTFPEGQPDGEPQTIRATVSLVVEGEEIGWLSPEQAIDALLADPRFAEVLAATPPSRWADYGIAFDRDSWVVSLDIGTPPGNLSEPDLVGVVDARTGRVLEIERLESR
jgi:hypothetical protein